MIFTETEIDGVVVIEMEPLTDERGMFARTYSAAEFAERGLLGDVVEANVSRNHQAGTLRGLHFQKDPYPDPKIVRCTSGALFDVAVDLRHESPTFCSWFGTMLTATDHTMLHVPAGCAHGYLTMADDTEVSYLMGERYHADLSGGVRWDDPAFDIDWPAEPRVMSARDALYPDHPAQVDRPGDGCHG